MIHFLFNFQAEGWTPLKKAPKPFAKNPNIYSISKENIEDIVGEDFEIPIKPEFGSKYRRRRPVEGKRSRPVVKTEEILVPFLDNSNFTDAPKIEKTITEGRIENNLARPVLFIPNNEGDIERIDVLPTPVKPRDWDKKEKIFYKSQIKWLDSSININDVTTAATKDTSNVKEIEIKDVAEKRTFEIELPEKSDYNLDYTDDYTKETTIEPEMMNFSDEESGEDETENYDLLTEKIKVLFDPPDQADLSHIPIYLELPNHECPKFCIRVNVEITRMAKQIGTRCRSSAYCNSRRRRK